MDKSSYNDISIRLGRVWDMLRRCSLCPRRCGVDRTRGEKGFCGVGAKAKIFREMMFNEEIEEINPSHQVYFAGCNLRCGYCSVGEYNTNPGDAAGMDVREAGERVKARKVAGARSLNLLGGEPAVSLMWALELLQIAGADTKTVWNSNMYYSDEAGEMLDGLIDLHIADLKFGNSECSQRICGRGDYFEMAGRAIRAAARRGKVVIRHLVMPGHVQCCAGPVIRWIAENAPEARVSIRADYAGPADETKSPGGYAGAKEIEYVRAMVREAELTCVREYD